MVVQQTILKNEVGLHARPATFFVQMATGFTSTIWIEKDGKRVNAKSLLGVLSLAVGQGDTIDIVAEGEDERSAVRDLVDLVENKLESVMQTGVSP